MGFILIMARSIGDISAVNGVSGLPIEWAARGQNVYTAGVVPIAASVCDLG